MDKLIIIVQVVKVDNNKIQATQDNKDNKIRGDHGYFLPGHPDLGAGRKLAFKNAEEVADKIQEYFEQCKKGQIKDIVTTKGQVVTANVETPRTISGLALALGVTTRTIRNYSERDEFFPVIARAKQCCEDWVEQQLFSGNDRGAKLWLINNADYHDTKEVVSTTQQPITSQSMLLDMSSFSQFSRSELRVISALQHKADNNLTDQDNDVLKCIDMHVNAIL
jgi:hypothetical protein